MKSAPMFRNGKVTPQWEDVIVPIGASDCPKCGTRDVLYRFEDFTDSSQCAECWKRDREEDDHG